MSNANLENCRKLFELSGWDNNAGTSSADRLEVWMPSYSLSMMGEGNPDYHKTPANERSKVEIGNMHITDDPRHRIGVPEVVFNWWYRDVKELEKQLVPAYDLGYLSRKLLGVRLQQMTKNIWTAQIVDSGTMTMAFASNGSTPEDAACLLACKLFETGILKKGQ